MVAATLNGSTSASELQAAARKAYLDSVDEGSPLSGAELGRRFDRSPRWGLDRVVEARAGRSGDSHRRAEPLPISTDDSSPAAGSHADGVGSAATAAERHSVGMPVAADRQPVRSWQDSLTTLLVALVAAAASYGHMYEVALMAGESTWIARAWPVTVDGLAFAALRRGDAGRWWLVLSLVVSVAANVVAQFPELATMAGPAVSAWPPLALFGTHRLLHRP